MPITHKIELNFVQENQHFPVGGLVASGNHWPTYIVRTSRLELEKKGGIQLSPFEDDLGQFEAAFFCVQDVLFFIRRYAHASPDEYTLFFDSGHDMPGRVDFWKLSDILLEALGLGQHAILWRNEALNDLSSR